jgi:hypothetical protein
VELTLWMMGRSGDICKGEIKAVRGREREF